MTRTDALNEQLSATPYGVSPYSPGDGVTRYRFARRRPNGTPKDYFETDGVVTVRGFVNARKIATALQHAYFEGLTRREA